MTVLSNSSTGCIPSNCAGKLQASSSAPTSNFPKWELLQSNPVNVFVSYASRNLAEQMPNAVLKMPKELGSWFCWPEAMYPYLAGPSENFRGSGEEGTRAYGSPIFCFMMQELPPKCINIAGWKRWTYHQTHGSPAVNSPRFQRAAPERLL